MSFTTPVLFLIFNRPDTTQRVFEAIRKAQPKRLYVAGDGPRKYRDGESALVSQVRAIATAVDWDCEIKILFRDENFGCGKAVSQAISWFFENEEMGIIMEDDCLPHPDFWRFCQELLERYKDDERVMAISGDNFQKGPRYSPYSYYFSRYPHVWGWASWARAWKHYDFEMRLWSAAKEGKWLQSCFVGELKAGAYWVKVFDRVANGEIDTWDYQWHFVCWVQNGLTILPVANLVSNIGFDSRATHTVDEQNSIAALPVSSIGFPLEHPPVVVRNAEWDAFYDKQFIVRPIPRRVLGRIVKGIRALGRGASSC